jgi:hypothetical protein
MGQYKKRGRIALFCFVTNSFRIFPSSPSIGVYLNSPSGNVPANPFAKWSFLAAAAAFAHFLYNSNA